MAVHIVEDDPSVADSLRLLLTEMGQVAFAYPDAESLFEVRPPGQGDTLIVDLGLPGISGAQIIRWAKGLSSAPRIVAITGQSQTAINDALTGDELPMVLRKPLVQDELSALFGNQKAN